MSPGLAGSPTGGPVSGPWTVGLVTVEFRDDVTADLITSRHTYHVMRKGDSIELKDGEPLRGVVTAVVWGDEITTIYIEQRP